VKGEVEKRRATANGALAAPSVVPKQRKLLRDEGVRFEASGRVPLGEFGWSAEAQLVVVAANSRIGREATAPETREKQND